MLPVFKDPALQLKFENEGCVKIKLLSEAQVKKLRDFYTPVQKEHEAAIREVCLYSTFDTGKTELLIAVDNIVKETIMEEVEKVFINYQTLISNYLVKGPGNESEMLPHQDLSFVDEPEHCSFNIWIPLQKTDKDTGQLRVLKGSHKIQHTLRVTPSYPWPYNGKKELMNGLLTGIDTEVGECVVINHAVIHGSSKNLSGQPRVAVILTLCSAPADVFYYHMPEGNAGRIEKYLMQPDMYYDVQADGRPARAKLLEYVSWSFDPIKEETFKRWVKNDSYLGLWDKARLLLFE